MGDGATTARWIIEIEPRGCDIGAMLIRRTLWRMNREAGDGSRTMAELCRVILNEGMRYVVQFNHDPLPLRGDLENGLKAVLHALAREAKLLPGKEQSARMAQGKC